MTNTKWYNENVSKGRSIQTTDPNKGKVIIDTGDYEEDKGKGVDMQ